MVKKIRLENFKAFEEAEIELKPLTLIVGPNSVGKTSLLQSIKLIQQTLSGNGSDILNLRGTFDFGDFDDILHQNSKTKELKIRFEFEEGTYFDVTISENDGILNVKNFLSDVGEFKYELRNLEKIGPDESNFYRPEKYEFIFTESKRYSKYFNSNSDLTFYRDGFLIIPQVSKETLKSAIMDIVCNDLEPNLSSNGKETLHNRKTRVKFEGENKDKILLAQTYMSLESYCSDFKRSIKQKFENIIYLGPIREMAAREYKSGHYDNVGFKGEHTVSIMRENVELNDKIKKTLKDLNIATSVEMLPSSNSKSFQLLLGTDITSSFVNFADIGCGTSQVLPILTQILHSKEDSIIIIEQPEIHLHPKLQADLASFIVESIKSNTKLLIETHSEYFVERIRTCIMKNPSLAKDVIIYYIEPNKEEKKSEIKHIIIDNNGQYSKLPNDYLTNFSLYELDTQLSIMYDSLREK